MHFLQKNLAKQDSNLSQISSNSSTSTHFPNILTTPKLTRPRPLTDDWLAASEFLMQKGKQRRKGQAMPWMYLVCILYLNVHCLAILVDFVLIWFHSFSNLTLYITWDTNVKNLKLNLKLFFHCLQLKFWNQTVLLPQLVPVSGLPPGFNPIAIISIGFPQGFPQTLPIDIRRSWDTHVVILHVILVWYPWKSKMISPWDWIPPAWEVQKMCLSGGAPVLFCR